MFVEAPKKPKKQPENIFNPRWWQEKGISFFLKKAAAGLFLAPGLGKTAIALFAFYFLQRKKVVNKMLVVSQKRIIYNVWRQEVEKWQLPFEVALVHGQSKDKHGKTKKRRALESEADIYLINFEALEWLLKQPPRIVKEKFAGAMLVVDESSKLKGWTNTRTSAIKKLLPLFKRRYILSGSPTPNSMQDIFAQIFLLDMGDTLGRYIGDFRNEYFYTVENVLKNPQGVIVRRWNDYELMEGAEDEIYKRLRKIVLRIPEEVVGLDPYIPLTREVVLPPGARKIYEEVEKEFIAWLASGNVLTAANAGVVTGKLRQIASGAVYFKTVQEAEAGEQVRVKKDYEVIHTEKYDELEQLVAELRGLPALIAYEYDHERIEIQKRFKCPAIYGGTSDRETETLIAQWNAGKLPVLLAHPASVSHGLNLQGTKAAVVFFTCGYNLDNHEQLIRRVWRQGQKGRVTVYYINTVNTLDEVVQGVLTLKDTNQKRLLKALETMTVPTKEGDNMATKKKAQAAKKASKKKPAKKVAKKAPARKKVPVKKKVAKKAAKKKAPVKKKTAAKKKAPKARTDGLRPGSCQAQFVDLAKRKTGVTMDEALKRIRTPQDTPTNAPSLRVMVNLLRKKGFNITKERGKAYKLAA
jgi:hypothetical protein